MPNEMPSRSNSLNRVFLKLVTALQPLNMATIAVTLWALTLPAIAQSPQMPPNEFVRKVINHELTAENNDHSHWMFRLETEKKNGQKDVDDVIETKDGDLKRPILIDGHQPTPDQRKQIDNHLGKDLQELRKNHKDKSQDEGQSQQMLKMLPDAFLYSYGKREGDEVELTFKPNPKFHPDNHEAEVFHAMQGSIWLDAKQNRLAHISGRLMKEVKFFGGLLGHLDPGGTFDVKQGEVSPGYWELTMLNVEMNGKALFFKTISVRQEYRRSEFKLVPNDTTIAQGVEMLMKGSTQSAALQQIHH